MLIVIRAEPAIVRTAFTNTGLRCSISSGFIKASFRKVIVGIFLQQFVMKPVLRTVFLQKNMAFFQHDFRRNPLHTLRTQAGCSLVKGIVAVFFHHLILRVSFVASKSERNKITFVFSFPGFRNIVVYDRLWSFVELRLRLHTHSRSIVRGTRTVVLLQLVA